MRWSTTPRSSPQVLDAVGLGLVVLLGLWTAVGAAEGRSTPVLLLLAAIVAAVVIGRRLAVHPGLVPKVLAVAVAGATVLSWPRALQAAGAPTGYANTNATLTGLGVLAAIAAARTANDQRWAWLGLAGLLAVLTVATGSVAGSLTLGAALSLLVVSALLRWPGAVIGGGLIVVVATLGFTVAVALGGDPFGLGGRAGVRGELWAGAVELLREHPWRGAGPGSFADQHPVTDDADLRWAHHGYLQAAAELGVVGFGLVIALLGVAWARLWATARQAPVRAALGAAALLVVTLHATIDYAWHVPAVVLVAAILVGGATASLGQDERPPWANSLTT